MAVRKPSPRTSRPEADEGRDGKPTGKHRAKALARAWTGSTILLVSQSLIFGLASLPALLFWQLIFAMTRGFPLFDPYGRYVLVAMSLIPSYVLFAISLMFISAGWNRLVGWRTEPGEYKIHDYEWPVIKWACYNASISVVRIFAGEPMRATPLWTYYLKANGAKIGKAVYVNSARLYDHNLLVLEDKTVVGGDAKLVAHLAEGGRIRAKAVIMRRKAIVGLNSVVSPGVEIGEGAALGALSFVPKDTLIPPGEAWGGVPAKPIRKFTDEELDRPGPPGIPALA